MLGGDNWVIPPHLGPGRAGGWVSGRWTGRQRVGDGADERPRFGEGAVERQESVGEMAEAA